jgi:hypothetical protein
LRAVAVDVRMPPPRSHRPVRSHRPHHVSRQLRRVTRPVFGHCCRSRFLYRAGHGRAHLHRERPLCAAVAGRRGSGHGAWHLVDALPGHVVVQPADSAGLRPRHHGCLAADRHCCLGIRAAARLPGASAAQATGAWRAGARQGRGQHALHGHGGIAHATGHSVRPVVVSIVDPDRRGGIRGGALDCLPIAAAHAARASTALWGGTGDGRRRRGDALHRHGCGEVSYRQCVAQRAAGCRAIRWRCPFS